jgi:ankyrin repeat protein
VWGAAALGYGDILGRMIARGADRDARDAAGDTPLIFAIDFERPEIVQVLLEAGADIDAAGRHGKRPLHHAAARGDLDLLRLLLRAGAAPDPSDENGVTPLMEAVRRGSEPATRRLLEAGASVHRRDGAGRNAMFYLVPTMSASDIVGLLVDAGAEIGRAPRRMATRRRTTHCGTARPHSRAFSSTRAAGGRRTPGAATRTPC